MDRIRDWYWEFKFDILILDSCEFQLGEFQEALDNCDLSEVQYSGSKFSWCNNQPGRCRILSQIDRMFTNNMWDMNFVEWRVKVHPRVISDHALMLGYSITVPKPSNVPFKFNASWINHQNKVGSKR